MTYLDRAAFWSLARSRGKFRADTVFVRLPFSWWAQRATRDT